MFLPETRKGIACLLFDVELEVPAADRPGSSVKLRIVTAKVNAGGRAFLPGHRFDAAAHQQIYSDFNLVPPI
jgi:hypothetical protein